MHTIALPTLFLRFRLRQVDGAWKLTRIKPNRDPLESVSLQHSDHASLAASLAAVVAAVLKDFDEDLPPCMARLEQARSLWANGGRGMRLGSNMAKQRLEGAAGEVMQLGRDYAQAWTVLAAVHREQGIDMPTVESPWLRAALDELANGQHTTPFRLDLRRPADLPG